MRCKAEALGRDVLTLLMDSTISHKDTKNRTWRSLWRIFMLSWDEGGRFDKKTSRSCDHALYAHTRGGGLFFPLLGFADHTVVVLASSVRNCTVNYLGKKGYSAIILSLETPLPPVGVCWRGGSARKPPRPFCACIRIVHLPTHVHHFWQLVC